MVLRPGNPVIRKPCSITDAANISNSILSASSRTCRSNLLLFLSHLFPLPANATQSQRRRSLFLPMLSRGRVSINYPVVSLSLPEMDANIPRKSSTEPKVTHDVHMFLSNSNDKWKQTFWVLGKIINKQSLHPKADYFPTTEPPEMFYSFYSTLPTLKIFTYLLLASLCYYSYIQHCATSLRLQLIRTTTTKKQPYFHISLQKASPYQRLHI